MIFRVLFFGLLCIMSIIMTITQKFYSKVPFYKNIATAIFLVTLPIVIDAVINPYFTLGWVDYRVDNMKEFSVTSKTRDKIEVYFTYQVQTNTLFGTKIIPLSSEQFSKLKIGDYVDKRGNKISSNDVSTEDYPEIKETETIN